MIKKRYYILIISIALSFLFILFSYFYIKANNQNKNTTPIYRLYAYENSIALYKNEEIIKVYREIVLNSLPKYDQEEFKKGIVVSNIDKIDEILEDFE